MKTQTAWTVSDTRGAHYLGTLEANGGAWEVLSLPDRLVFGSACNVGFLESGFLLREEGETLDAALYELLADLEAYPYQSRIVCNERM